MDRHDFAAGVTAIDIAGAHLKDLEVQGRFGVRFLNYWFDVERQTAFCLAEGPSGEAVENVHSQSHGLIANQVIEVDQRALERFMGWHHQPPGRGAIRRDRLPNDPLH